MSLNSSADTVYPREITVFAAACAILFCFLGVLGNSVTIVALIRSVKLRTHATTAFVISLCISDLLFCALNLPLTAVRYIYEAWTLGDALCQLFPVLFYGNVAVSLLNMVAITLNRYVLISCFSYYNRIYTTALIWTQLMCAWGIAFLIMLPPLLGVWGQLGLNHKTFSCTILDKDGSSPKKLIFLIGFVLPMIVIIVSYSCIYWRVRHSRKKVLAHDPLHSRETSQRTSNREREDRRLTRMMLVIFICFVICFLPLMIVNVFLDDLEFPVLGTLASIMAWLSSVINPFIYAASNRQYRTAYTDLLNIFRRGKGMAGPQESRVTQSGNSLKSCATDMKNIHSKEASKSYQKPSPI